MKICILRETKKPVDARVPLTPGQCRVVEEKFHDMKIVVQPSTVRCFKDEAYIREGIKVTEDISDCDIFIGVKEVAPQTLIEGKTYLFFSHTIKKQEHNRNLLKTVLDKKITLIDYELLTDANGIRIIGFGRWAGLVGSYLGIRAYCMRYHLQPMPQVSDFASFAEMTAFARTYKLPSMKVVITGDGRVGKGVVEMMDYFRIRRVDTEKFLNESFKHPVYTQLSPGEYNKRKFGEFYLMHFFSNPHDYEGDFEKYTRVSDVLIASAYWDPRSPVLFTLQEMNQRDFKIRVIADISCDLNGSIPTTIRTSTFDEPYYDVELSTAQIQPAFSGDSNVTVMAIDNLPCGLPAEASADFGQALIRNIFPLFADGDQAGILQRATIAREGRLNPPYAYLDKWINTTDQSA